MFAVVVRDIIYQEESVILTFGDKLNALNYIEEYIHGFINDINGVSDSIKYYKIHPVAAEFKEGAYVKIKGFEKYQIIIRRRNVGYMWNSFDDIKMFDISIAKMEEFEREKSFKNYFLNNDGFFEKIEMSSVLLGRFNDCLKELPKLEGCF